MKISPSIESLSGLPLFQNETKILRMVNDLALLSSLSPTDSAASILD